MNDAVSQLCPNCGLCCDSTLFADVELRKGDDAKRLAKLGLTIYQKSKSKPAFAQPCACFDGKFCKIYNDRPRRCRFFECGLLKKLQANEISATSALAKIVRAKHLAGKVREMIRSSGQGDEQLALTKRYAQAMREPVDLSDEAAAGLRGELMLAVSDLMQLLQRDFLE